MKKLKLTTAAIDTIYKNVHTAGCPSVDCTILPSPEESPWGCDWPVETPTPDDYVVGCQDGKLVLFPLVDCAEESP